MTITAKVIAHSRPNWADGASHDLFTLELKYPRFLHSEFMTHRVFSRNASSSRAVPVPRVVDAVAHDPVIPAYWGVNRPGMQAREELHPAEQEWALTEWRAARIDVLDHVFRLNDMGVHKQLVNRLLEPWSHITVLVTATEWDNFFALRDHPDAQPEIQALARAMRAAMQGSEPVVLEPGAWHLPYALVGDMPLGHRIYTSVAGCARVSYGTHDGANRTVEADMSRAQQLHKSGHWSPFEHQATPMAAPEGGTQWETGVTHMDRRGRYWSGNFRGWVQHRQLAMPL